MPTTELTGQQAVLSHIAVAPGGQGAGIGGQLLEAFVQEARAAGSPHVVLVTLAGQDGAAGFYRRQGWVERGRQANLDGQAMLIFSLPLRPEYQ